MLSVSITAQSMRITNLGKGYSPREGVGEAGERLSIEYRGAGDAILIEAPYFGQSLDW